MVRSTVWRSGTKISSELLGSSNITHCITLGKRSGAPNGFPTFASAIRNNEQIKGITVDGVESKISIYADDTTLILDGNKSSMVASFDTLDAFHKISGLKVNNEKTEVLWIGASSGNQQEF